MAYDYDKSELDSLMKDQIRNTGKYRTPVHFRDELGEYTDVLMGENAPLEEGRKKAKADRMDKNIMDILGYISPPRHEWLDPQPPRDRDKEMNQWVKNQGNPTITSETEEINYQGESGEFINKSGDRISYELQDPSILDSSRPEKTREARIIEDLKRLESNPFMELQNQQELEEKERIKDWYNKSEMYGY